MSFEPGRKEWYEIRDELARVINVQMDFYEGAHKERRHEAVKSAVTKLLDDGYIAPGIMLHKGDEWSFEKIARERDELLKLKTETAKLIQELEGIFPEGQWAVQHHLLGKIKAILAEMEGAK